MDDHVFRGAALGEAHNPADPVDPIIEMLMAMMRRVGDRHYPPQFVGSLGAFEADPQDVARMREAISGLPRVDPEDYDILFNAMERQWAIVKWVDMTQGWGDVPGIGYLYETVYEPWPVYEIDARYRSPASLGDTDWARLRSRCSTVRDPDELDAELRALNMAARQEQNDELEDQEEGFLEYYHGLFREVAEELGIDGLSPEEAARRFGGHPLDWDPEHVPGMR